MQIIAHFPNLLEPWTELRICNARDSVRKNAVLVVSHLILNDMIKEHTVADNKQWEYSIFYIHQKGNQKAQSHSRLMNMP